MAAPVPPLLTGRVPVTSSVRSTPPLLIVMVPELAAKLSELNCARPFALVEASVKSASINVCTLLKADFRFVPLAPLSTIIKSEEVRSSPISVPASIFSAVRDTLFAVAIVPSLVSAIEFTAIVILPELVTGVDPIVNSEAPPSANPTEVTVPTFEGVTFVNEIPSEPNEAVLFVVHNQMVL